MDKVQKLKGDVNKVREKVKEKRTVPPTTTSTTTFYLQPSGMCPGSYIYDPGNVPGNGLEWLSSIENIASCAGHCNANINCCSFEYSASQTKPETITKMTV